MSQSERLSLPTPIFLIPAILLLVALAPLPYGYYVLLRIVVCAASAFIAYREYSKSGVISSWFLMMVGIALIFNPIIPIHLSREIWAPIDIFAALAFFFHWRVRG